MHDLREALESLTDDGSPHRGAAEVFRRAQHHSVRPGDTTGSDTTRKRRVRGRVVVALGALVAMAGVAIFLSVRNQADEVSTGVSTSQPSSDVTSPPSSDFGDLSDTSSLRPETKGALYVVPGYLPKGMQLLRVEGGDAPNRVDGGGGSTEIDRWQLWVEFDAAGKRPINSFGVQWGPGATAELPGLGNGGRASDDPLEGFRGQSVPVEVRGLPGLYSQNLNGVVWEEPAGKMVGVFGRAPLAEPRLSSDELLEIAEGLRLRDDGGFTVTTAPDGYVLVSEAAGFAYEGKNPRELIYRAADGRAVRIRVVDGPEAPPGVNLQDGFPEGDAHVVEVRGRHAVVTRRLLTGGGGNDQQTQFLQSPDLNVQWLEPGNVAVTVSTVGLTEKQAVAIANELRSVDRDSWEDLMVRAPSRNGSAAASGSTPPFRGTDADIAKVYAEWLSATDVNEIAAVVEGGEALRPTIRRALADRRSPGEYSGRVDAVRAVDDDRAFVSFAVLVDGGGYLKDQQGSAVRVDGRWLVSRATYCAIVALSGVDCPVP